MNTRRIATLAGCCAALIAATCTASAGAATPATWLAGRTATVEHATACGSQLLVTWGADSSDELFLSLVDARGRYDTSFGPAGLVTTSDTARVACAPDGSVYLVLDDPEAVDPAGSIVEHLLPDGQRDDTFGDGLGSVTAAINAEAVTVDTLGRVVLAGTTVAGGRGAIERLQADGAADTTFGAAGVYTAPVGTPLHGLESVVSMPDGSVTAGTELAAVGGTRQTVATHLSSNGLLDTRWGVNGVAQAPAGAGVADEVLGIDAAGRVYVQRSRNGAGTNHAIATQIVRIGVDGVLDRSWGAHGGTGLPARYAFLGAAAVGRFGLAAVEFDDVFGAPVLGSLRLTAAGRPYPAWPHGLARVPAGLRSPMWVTTTSGAPEFVGMRTLGSHQRFVVAR